MFELVPSVLAFALAMTITPGPNNVMVMASGLNFGYRRTVPHMLGISVGFPVMLIAVGAGLGAIIQGHPDVHRTLSYVGAAYLLWLSWKIATAAAAEAGAATGRPIGFFSSCGIPVGQSEGLDHRPWRGRHIYLGRWQYRDRCRHHRHHIRSGRLPVVSLWALFGGVLGRPLHRPRLRIIFNVGVALLLVGSLAWPLVLSTP